MSTGVFKRRTSTYLVLLATSDPDGTLDGMISGCPVEVSSSTPYPAQAGVRFRCESDDATAWSIALQIAAGEPFKLLTGYGINQREVTL